MTTVERYSSFEQMDDAQSKDAAKAKKKKSSKETPGQKLFKEFAELPRKGIVSVASLKK